MQSGFGIGEELSSEKGVRNRPGTESKADILQLSIRFVVLFVLFLLNLIP